MTLQDDVSALKDGDYVRAEYKNRDGIQRHEGFARMEYLASIWIGSYMLATSMGSPTVGNLSVTVIDPPLPPEPLPGSFGLTKNRSIFKKVNGGIYSWREVDNLKAFSWAEIYPQIVKMWDPSGEEVQK